MQSLTSEKLAQAETLVAASGVDIWLTFDRKTADGGDPVLPLIIEGGLTWETALMVTKSGRRVAIAGNFDCPPIESSGDWHEVVPYVQSIRQPLIDDAARRYIVAAGYPEYMHALGHQVGRMAHDGGGILGPRWERYGRTPYHPVEKNQIYTIELGVTVEGRGCVGIEEMVLVTESGVEWLTDRQMDMPLLSR